MTMADTLQPSPGGAPETAAPGTRLSEARQAQNLAATDVARQLKLSVWQVEALEAGRYQELPGPIFVRGFIRNYARLVKLDSEELLRAAGASLPQQAARPETPPSHDIPFPTAHAPRWPRYAVAAAVIFGALAIYEFVWNEPEGTPAPTRSVAVTPVPVAPKAKLEGLPPPAQAARESSASRPTITAATAAVTIPEPPAALAAAQPEAQSLPRPGEKRVRLDFNQESWVEIRDRNERIIFSQLNRPGTMQQVNGLPPLSVVVGNAHGVKMTYGDQPVDLARHTKIDVARLVLE
jgi:cytoskeleton protein RodZ